jgi:hypothetical protein
MRLTVGDRGSRNTQHLHHLSISCPALELNIHFVLLRRVGLWDGVKVRARGGVGTRGKIIKVYDGDFTVGARAAMIFDAEMPGNVSDGFSFYSNKNSREVDAGEANRINGVRVGIGARGVGDKMSLPMFSREFSDGESRHGFMLEEETVVCLVVSLEKDRGLLTKEGTIMDGVLPVLRRGENRQPGPNRRREKGHTIRPRGEVGSLKDKRIRVEESWVDEGKG